uniref:Uncharacterized protein n=1 Tax=Picea glauca TaxID=3330 RepID=A0A117NHH3_PICGL|nr:hypothetical protein ABT39_MTgene5378 [Picea glauca]QHR86403.1 hypothetical protein Q903MT_gene402 [Picea sitchensis]
MVFKLMNQARWEPSVQAHSFKLMNQVETRGIIEVLNCANHYRTYALTCDADRICGTDWTTFHCKGIFNQPIQSTISIYIYIAQGCGRGGTVIFKASIS